MKRKGLRCRCIRCREVGHTGEVLDDPSEVRLGVEEYEANGGKERFISYTYRDSLVGYVRLRTDDSDLATVRELKVFGDRKSVG